MAKELVKQLESRGFKVARMYTGHMMTSLEMAGILISLLKVTDHPDWLRYLDAPTEAPTNVNVDAPQARAPKFIDAPT